MPKRISDCNMLQKVKEKMSVNNQNHHTTSSKNVEIKSSPFCVSLCRCLSYISVSVSHSYSLVSLNENNGQSRDLGFSWEVDTLSPYLSIFLSLSRSLSQTSSAELSMSLSLSLSLSLSRSLSLFLAHSHTHTLTQMLTNTRTQIHTPKQAHTDTNTLRLF